MWPKISLFGQWFYIPINTLSVRSFLIQPSTMRTPVLPVVLAVLLICSIADVLGAPAPDIMGSLGGLAASAKDMAGGVAAKAGQLAVGAKTAAGDIATKAGQLAVGAKTAAGDVATKAGKLAGDAIVGAKNKAQGAITAMGEKLNGSGKPEKSAS